MDCCSVLAGREVVNGERAREKGWVEGMDDDERPNILLPLCRDVMMKETMYK
jgi:hypothetical protein